ncbi:protein jag [Gloeobacter kilaueensis]|uniref:Single-stranded nucleic acid binding R3H domain-containing protein n=1 Tax=Gloeobacter kilaueensis (strain ATCC BAA-2537 / CCAP 1431/1 / ULC 316 / JS1) TaxID=1183438 RepID=U5QFQ4_GLOK1|nr:R3H domain-containing nucleic acid-binding protein [Gloeobacter kilaueensis]AGY57766.1 single-stranded nucleic acid binding R3H domain-containing protein [Gloeobacter kilaueensis JS1]
MIEPETETEEARRWLQSVLQLMGLPDGIQLTPAPNDPASLPWLEIREDGLTSAHKELLLAREGEALDALQFLLNTTMHLQSDHKQAYTVELAGYRHKRHQQLSEMAWEAAAAVRSSGQEFVFGALSAAERRQIHMLLQEEPDLATYSRGKEPERRLVVRPRTDEDDTPGADE